MIFRKTILCVALTILLCTNVHAYDIKLLSEIPLKGKASAIAVNTATDIAAVVSATGQSLSVIDTISGAVTHDITLPAAPSGVAVHKGSNRAIVPAADGSLLLYDLTSGDAAGTIATGTPVYAIAVDELSNSALLGVDGGVKTIDLSSGGVLLKFNIPGIAKKLSPGKSLAIASVDAAGSRLVLMDPATGAIAAKAALSGEATSMGRDDALGFVLVTLSDKPGLFIYDAATLKPLGEVQTGKQVEIVSVNPSTHTAVLADTLGGTLSIVDLAGKAIIASVPLFGQMGPLTVDPARNRVLAAHNDNLAIVQLENPVPRISGLIPLEREAEAEGFPLTITGEKFVKDSRTSFGGSLLDSMFDSNELIRAYIPADKLLMPGNVPVSVVNPPPGGGVSNELTFKVLTPAPQLSAVSPAMVVSGGPAFTLRVEGKNFLPVAVVNFNGKKLETNFLSSTVLEVKVNAAFITTQGSYPVSVTSNGPTSFTSNALSVIVASAEEAAKAAVVRAAVSMGTGSLGGRILNTEMKPLKGVTIKFKGMSAQTDEYGNFTLEDLPAGKRTILLDGSTAEETDGHYPVIPISVNITAGMRNPMPFTPYLHRQKSYNFANIDPASDTVLTDPEVPGFEMRIPTGVNIIGWDGKANLKVSVRTVPVNRLPVKPVPANSNIRTVYMFYFNKVGGGKPDRPIPIKSANDLGLLPGEKAILWYYDESPNEGEAPNDWAIAGTGTVTSDGRYVVTDPGVGIPKFCCGATAWEPQTRKLPTTSKQPDSKTADPVDITTGYFSYEHTDLTIPGIIPVNIKRYYRSRDSGSAVQGDATGLGAFGKGMYFEYDWALGTYNGVLRLTKPGTYHYDFSQALDGSYIDSTDPDMIGAKVVVNTDSTMTLRMRDGWRYNFNTNGELVQVADRNGNAITITRVHLSTGGDWGGVVSQITTAEGRVVTFNMTYVDGDFHRIDSITDSSGRTVTYTYENDPFNSYPRLKQVGYPDGSSIQYGYDPVSGLMTTITNGRGVTDITNVYDSNYRVMQQTLSDGSTYTFDYSVAGQTTMTAPNGAQTVWSFNGYNYIWEMITPDGTTRYARSNTTNQLASITDPLQRTTSYTYYSTGDAKNGLVHTVTDPLNNVTTYDYEPTYGLPTKITDALGKITTITSTPAALPPTQAVITDPLTNQTTITFNSFGMPTSITDPNNNTTTFTYDPNHHAELTGVTDALGNLASYTYDSIGRLSTKADAKGAQTVYTYDPMDRIASVTDPFGMQTRYLFDGNGNLDIVIDAMGNSIFYEYDNRDRITKMTDQLGRYETYAYYTGSQITLATGNNLMSYTDRKGQTTTFNQYDAMNRLKQVTFGDSSTINYQYDAIGRTTNINDSISGVIGYTYNDYGSCTLNCSGRAIDLISQEATPLSTINYTYDADRRRQSMTVAGEPVVNYIFDDAGRLINLSRVIGSGTRTYNLGYDNAGRRTSVQIPLANGTDSVTTTYGYDAANHVTNLLLQGAATIIESLSYTYDPNGDRNMFGRIAAQVLSPAVSGTSYDAANEMLAFNGKNVVYDANGNLLTKSDACGTTTYTWDARSRLTAINGYKPDCTGLNASFSYDALNRRISKTINGTTTQYIYDRWDIIQEIKSGVTTDYIRSLNIDEPLTRITGSTIRHYVKDGLGSVLAMTDDAGVAKTTFVYDAFGNATVTGETSDNPFQYTSRENDGTGLLHYRFRYYSPEMQRFIKQDPIRLRGGINYYSFVQNSPINYIDPFGLFSILGYKYDGIEYGGAAGIMTVSSKWGGTSTQVTVSTPQIGAGIKFNFSRCEPLRKYSVPLQYTIGSKWAGISFSDDMKNISIGVGPAIGPPITIEKNIDSFDATDQQ